MNARTRLARWTLPVLLTTGAVLLTACGEQTDGGPGEGTTVATESPEPTPAGGETNEPAGPTASEDPEPEATETPEPSEPGTGGLRGALLPAEEVPGFNEEFTWSEKATSGTEPAELAGTCHQFELASIGAEKVAYRTYEPAERGGDAMASQLVARFPDDKTAERAEQVLLSWRDDCKRNLKKFDKVDVGDPTDVTIDQGTGSWYLLVYGPAEGDPDSGYFDAQGVVRVGPRITVLRMALVGQDYNYTEGEEPMVAAVRAAAARL